MPTNSIKKASKKAESNSDSGLSIGNIISGVTVVGGAGLVAFVVMWAPGARQDGASQ